MCPRESRIYSQCATTIKFVAIVALFTPKSVETQNERERMVFRVKAKISSETLRQNNSHIKSGMPGMAYVRLDPPVPWPAKLAVRARRSPGYPEVLSSELQVYSQELALASNRQQEALSLVQL